MMEVKKYLYYTVCCGILNVAEKTRLLIFCMVPYPEGSEPGLQKK